MIIQSLITENKIINKLTKQGLPSFYTTETVENGDDGEPDEENDKADDNIVNESCILTDLATPNINSLKTNLTPKNLVNKGKIYHVRMKR